MFYQSTKKIKATPMDLGAYNTLREWVIPENEDPATDGYLVEYLDGGEPNHPDFENYISWSPKGVFDRNHFEISQEDAYGTEVRNSSKTVSNTDQSGCRDNVPDVEIFGEDLFKLLSKASSKSEGWMKSTKAMQVEGGCVVQVTTQQGDNVAEAVVFVPKVIVREIKRSGKVTARILI